MFFSTLRQFLKKIYIVQITTERALKRYTTCSTGDDCSGYIILHGKNNKQLKHTEGQKFSHFPWSEQNWQWISKLLNSIIYYMLQKTTYKPMQSKAIT